MNMVLGTNFQLKLKIMFLGIFGQKLNNTITFCFLWITPSTKFDFKQTTLNFGSRFAQKGFFG